MDIKKINCIKNLLTLFLSLLFSFLILELISRQFFYEGYLPKDLYKEDLELGYSHIPNSIVEYGKGQYVKINSIGLRSRDSIINYKEHNRTRIAFLGDSMVFAGSVPYENTFVAIVENLSNERFRTYNLGVSGYGTKQELGLLKRVFDEINPTIVIYVFTLNDLDNNRNKRQRIIRNGWLLTAKNKETDPIMLKYELLIFEYSNLARYLYNAFDRRKYLKYINKTRKLTARPLPRDDYFNTTLEYVVEMKRYVENKGAMFLVIANGSRRIIDPFLYLEYLQKNQNQFFNILMKNDIDFCDFTTEFMKAENVSELFIGKTNIHYSKKGHIFFGKLVYNYLASKIQ